MKRLEECKEYYKDLYLNVLEANGFERNIFDCVELAQYNAHRETLEFVYGAEFDKTEKTWQSEALREFYK